MPRNVDKLSRLLRRRYKLEGDLQTQAARAESLSLFEPGTLARLRFVARMADRRGGPDSLSDGELERAAWQVLSECTAGRKQMYFLLLGALGLLLVGLGGGLESSFIFTLATGVYAAFLFGFRHHRSEVVVTLAVVGVLGGIVFSALHPSEMAAFGFALLPYTLWRGSPSTQLRTVAVISVLGCFLTAVMTSA